MEPWIEFTWRWMNLIFICLIFKNRFFYFSLFFFNFRCWTLKNFRYTNFVSLPRMRIYSKYHDKILKNRFREYFVQRMWEELIENKVTKKFKYTSNFSSLITIFVLSPFPFQTSTQWIQRWTFKDRRTQSYPACKFNFHKVCFSSKLSRVSNRLWTRRIDESSLWTILLFFLPRAPVSCRRARAI